MRGQRNTAAGASDTDVRKTFVWIAALVVLAGLLPAVYGGFASAHGVSFHTRLAVSRWLLYVPLFGALIVPFRFMNRRSALKALMVMLGLALVFLIVSGGFAALIEVLTPKY